jgi:aspartyl-tRNA(Asn)/glutamyl-tRNA(Gln) amidotransferase subunit A
MSAGQLENATLAELSAQLDSGFVTSEELVAQALERVKDPLGQGQKTFITVYEKGALASARAIDAMRAEGMAVSPLAGIPISVKESFEIAGSTMVVGSKLFRDQPAAIHDAAVIRRLRGWGLVIIGRTNMTEFAFSTAGLNPHYGTPLNPYDRDNGRTPGGSSSGAAVSVTDGMAAAALASDTGGSIRVPAALCGLTGFKPTGSRIPLQGAASLARLMDSAGPIGRSVKCCALLDAVLRDDISELSLDEGPPLEKLRLGILRNYVDDGLEPQVRDSYEAALDRLRRVGAQLQDVQFPGLDEIPRIVEKGGLQAAEIYAAHQDTLDAEAELYDPRIRSRILRGRDMGAADYLDVVRERTEIVEQFERFMQAFDAVIMPTVPLIAPLISHLDSSDDVFHEAQMALLRNPSSVNMLDGCAITLPCHDSGAAPVGLSLVGAGNADDGILRAAFVVEKALLE